MHAGSSAQRAAKVESDSEQKENKRPEANTTNPRAGQLARRQRIPRKAQQQLEEEVEEKKEAEAKQSEPEVRYSSSGRLIRRPQGCEGGRQRSSKRRAEEAGSGGQRKRKKADNGSGAPARGSSDDDEQQQRQEVVDEEVIEVRPSSSPRVAGRERRVYV